MRRLTLVVATIVLAIAVLGDRTEDDLDVGDPCRITRTSEPGLCALITRCPAVAARAHSHAHTLCGFRALEPIVCCPLTVDALPATHNVQPPSTLSDEDLFPQSAPKPVSRISSQMCMEYHRIVHENISITKINGSTIEHRETRCPQMPPPFVTGDGRSMLWTYPHMALIGYESGAGSSPEWKCGGSLISDQFVLTAGHCVLFGDRRTPQLLGRSPQPIVVKLGANRIRRDGNLSASDPANAFVVDVPVAEVIAHPDYQTFAYYNDIGLLRLARRVTLSRFVRPICLATNEIDDTDSSAVATGWGEAEYGGVTGEWLLEVELEPFTFAACNESFRSLAGKRRLARGIDRRTQLCAGSYAESLDKCRSDSGGPLQTYYSDSYQPCLRKLIGVTSSFGKTCGAANNPGVFTRVFPYLTWIESIVWPAEATEAATA